MVPEIGHYALILALALSVALTAAGGGSDRQSVVDAHQPVSGDGLFCFCGDRFCLPGDRLRMTTRSRTFQ